MVFPQALLGLALATAVRAQQTPLDPPGQPSRKNAPIGAFEIVGDSIVSGQQLFLGTLDKVYIVDKVENNPTQIKGHPAWASEYSLSQNKGRPMDVVTNSFCAGGAVLGNGTWLNVGGNQAVTTGGQPAPSQNGGGVYDDPDGGKSLRLLDPCDDGSCDWVLTTAMTTRRWYPTCETLEDGSMIILGGCDWGGFVNDAKQDNPTYEFFPPPPDNTPIVSPLLSTTRPANLYPISFLLPSGRVLMQSNYGTALLDYKAKKEYKLSDMPHAVRTYPASAGTALLPLTPANNWTATVVFCGGMAVDPDDWDPKKTVFVEMPTSKSCVRLTPDVSKDYEEDDDLEIGRSMGSMIILPNGKIMYLNGAGTGVAGYGTESWTINESYADNPVMQPYLYDPDAAKGSRWSKDGLSPSTIPRMYHSTATLLPDGSVFVTGSNPHADYDVRPTTKFKTEYRVEYLYPSYFNEVRPQPKGIPPFVAYGGPFFNISLTKDDLKGDVQNIKKAQAVIIRTGFSTHAMNMGQRMIVLENSYTGNPDGSGVLHVSSLPPSAAIFPPGPALFFVVVDGVPSVGLQVMVGSGQIETQPTSEPAALPVSQIAQTGSSSDNSSSGSGGGDSGSQGQNSAAFSSAPLSVSALLPFALAGLLLLSSM